MNHFIFKLQIQLLTFIYVTLKEQRLNYLKHIPLVLLLNFNVSKIGMQLQLCKLNLVVSFFPPKAIIRLMIF